MNGPSIATIQIKKLTWLTLGLCFTLLYSCPVKKYFLLTYCGDHADESATCAFQRDVSGHCDRIVYLRRPCVKQIRLVIAATDRPSVPPVLFALSSPVSSFDYRTAIGRVLSGRNNALAAAPPRYLEGRRLLI